MTEKDLEKLKEKNKALYEKKNKINKEIDYSNLKETLKEFQDSYKYSEIFSFLFTKNIRRRR